MKPKLTPGLWRAFLMKSRFAAPRWHVSSEDLQILVARACTIKGEPDTAAANAVAIAALPLLIEALRQATESNETVLRLCTTDGVTPGVLRAQAAIQSALKQAGV